MVMIPVMTLRVSFSYAYEDQHFVSIAGYLLLFIYMYICIIYNSVK